MLVLGTGESGKSTVFKQMKILCAPSPRPRSDAPAAPRARPADAGRRPHRRPQCPAPTKSGPTAPLSQRPRRRYSVPDPPSKFIMVVRANLFGNAQSVHQGMEKLGIAYATPEGEAAGKLISSKPADGNVEPDDSLSAAFEKMYADAGVAEAIERAAEFQLNDSTIYFWERSKDILATDYMPTEQDVLRARVRTTGIVQQNFQIKDQKYTMFDVGGQRNERRKWIHCFDNVTAVIFVTAISEYDQARPRPPPAHPPRRNGLTRAWARRCCTRTRTRTAWTRRCSSSTRSATTPPSRRPR